MRTAREVARSLVENELRHNELGAWLDEYGTPDKPAVKLRDGWWDAPAGWNPGTTPREFYAHLVERDAEFRNALDWIGT